VASFPENFANKKKAEGLTRNCPLLTQLFSELGDGLGTFGKENWLSTK